MIQIRKVLATVKWWNGLLYRLEKPIISLTAEFFNRKAISVPHEERRTPSVHVNALLDSLLSVSDSCEEGWQVLLSEVARYGKRDEGSRAQNLHAHYSYFVRVLPLIKPEPVWQVPRIHLKIDYSTFLEQVRDICNRRFLESKPSQHCTRCCIFETHQRVEKYYIISSQFWHLVSWTSYILSNYLTPCHYQVLT